MNNLFNEGLIDPTTIKNELHKLSYQTELYKLKLGRTILNKLRY